MKNDVNLFEYATRAKLRFASSKGPLSVEQLWDVPLRSSDGFNLEVIAQSVNKALRDVNEERFVDEERGNPAAEKLEISLNVIKFVIRAKLGDEALAKKKAENRKELELLQEILAEKKNGELSELSIKELQRRIKALGAEV